MKFISLLAGAAAAVLFGCAAQPQHPQPPTAIHATPEDLARCAAAEPEGCTVWTREELAALLKQFGDLLIQSIEQRNGGKPL